MALQPKDPSAAVITSVGGSATGGSISSTTPVITGTADAGDVVSIYDGVRLLGTAVVAANGTWSFTPTTPLKAGNHSFAAIPVDSQGNHGASSNVVTAAIGSSAPATPGTPTVTDDTGHTIPAGGTTADSTPTFSGTGTAGDTITVYDNDKPIGSTTIAGDGTWSFTPTTPLPSGDNSIVVIETNPAGTPSSGSTPIHVVVDTSVPATPPAPTFTDDSGHAIPAGSTTADATPHINGTGTAGDTITVYDNGTAIGSTTVAADGTWSFTPTKPLPSGDNSITVTDTNAAGTSSAASTPTHVVIDTSTPATPAAPTFTDDSGHTIPAGGTTADATPHINGKGTAGDTITVYDNGKAIGSTTVAPDGTWSFTPTKPLADGDNSITVTDTNAAGTSSAASTPTHVVIDTSVPATPASPVITDDTGHSIPAGGTTSDSTPTFSGEGTAGDTITVYDNDKPIGSTTIDPDGTWSWTPKDPLPSGDNNIVIIETNPAGTPSSGSTPIVVVVDTSVPATPAAPTFTNDAGVAIPAGGTTADATPHIEGKGTAGDTITILDNGKAIGSTTVKPDGTWSYTPTTPLADGDNSITVTEKNAAGTSSLPSTPTHIVIDTSVPATPAAPTFTNDAGVAIPAGSTTADATPHIAGKGTAGDTITVYDNGKAIGSTTVAPDGTWSFTPTTPLADGDNSITVTDTNAAGTPSAASTPAHVVIDTSVPATPAAPTITDHSGHVLENGDTTKDLLPIFSGKGTAGDTITVYDEKGAVLGSATVAANGTWSFTPVTPLIPGIKAFSVTETNPLGTSSEPSPNAVVFMVNANAPATPAAPTFTDDSGTAIPTGSNTTDAHPHINGKGVAGDIITVYDSSTVIGSTTVGADGKWSFTPTTDLKPGYHYINVTEANASGTSPRSNDASIVISGGSTPSVPATPAAPTFTNDSGTAIPAGSSTTDAHPHINGTGVAGDTITVYDGNTVLGSTKVGADGKWSFTPASLTPGSHSINVTEANGSGTSGHSANSAIVIISGGGGTLPTPAAPTFTDDHGTTIPAGGTTTDSTPHINGTGTAGDTITVYDNGGALGTAIVAANGTWSFTPGAPLAGGANSITVVESNAAGAVSAPSSPVSINITAPVSVPDAPTLTNDGGINIPDGSSTNEFIPHISGRGVANDIITVYDGSTVLGTTKVAADGTWAFLPSAKMAAGSHSFNVTETNAAGTSGHSNSTTVSMLTPSLVITSITDGSGNTINNGGTVSGYFTVHGTATGIADGTFVDLVFNGTIRDEIAGFTNGRVLVQVVNGTFTFIASADSKGGYYNPGSQLLGSSGTVSVQAEAWYGSKTFATSNIYTAYEPALTNSYPSLKIPGTPATPVFTDDAGNVIASGSTTTNVKPHLSGTGTAGDLIIVLDNGAPVGTTVVDASGKWTFTPPALSNLVHVFTATEVNAAGVSPKSATVSLQVNTTGRPNQPDVPTLTDTRGNVIAPGASVGTSWVSVSGKGVASDLITVYLDGTAVGSVTVAANGTWTLQTPALSLGFIHRVDVTETNASGTSQHSNQIAFVPSSGSPLQSVHAVATGDTADAQDAANAAQGHAPDVTAPSSHTVVGEHDAFVGNAAHGNETVDLNADPASYFKESTAHIQGSGGAAIDTLHLTGDHQVLDLTALTGQTSAAKISAIEVFDLGGHANNLKVSLTDVLNLGETDLFQKDGHQQLMVKGSDGDTVDLSNAHIAGVADGQWQAEGTTVVGGVTYNVYEHSGAHTELLVQQGVQVALHN